MLGYRITGPEVRFVILLSMLLLSSCVELEEPLSDPKKAKTDARLSGAWRFEGIGEKSNGQKPDDPGYDFLFIGTSDIRGTPRGIMKAIEIVSNNDNTPIVKPPVYFFSASIGANLYANLVSVGTGTHRDVPATWDDWERKKNVLLKYKLEGDRLVVWLMDSKVAETAVRKGQLKGTVREEGGLIKLKCVILTDVAGLSKYLAEGGDKLLFPEKTRMIYSRVKPVNPR